MDSAEIYTIGAAAKASSLTPHILRAWETRYGVVNPSRDDSGRRKYSQADVELLSLLKRLTDEGHSIGRLAELSVSDLQKLRSASLASDAERLPMGEDVVEQLLAATREFDAFQLDRQLGRLMGTLPAPELVAQVLNPFLTEVGKGWSEGRFSIAQERLVSSTLQARIMGMLAEHSNLRQPQIALGTLTGEQHSLGLMLLALLAHERGLCCRYLGIDMPAESLAQACARLDVAVLAVSIVTPQPEDVIRSQLEELRSLLPDEIRLWLGGARCASLGQPIPGCETASELATMQGLLETIQRR